jgi:hypothetical protein
MQTTVDGAGTMSFYWKVSSEENYDSLEFYIDGSIQDQISGLVNWQQMEYSIDTSGSHTLEWRYIKDGSVSVDNDCGWVDRVEWGAGSEPPPPPPPPPSSGDLSEAVDTTLSFSTGGGADWFDQATSFYYGGDAAESGSIWHNQESWMRTTVDGAGTVSFYWKVSSEENYDSLEFYIDGVIQERIDGSVNWQQKVYTVNTSGSHTLEWRYIKDGSVSVDDDCGWVDQVEWNAGSEPPPPPPPPPPPSDDFSEALDTTLSFTTGGGADWSAQSDFSYYDGDAAQSGNIWGNQESWIETTVDGVGTVSFYWKVSSENYCDFLEFCIDDVLQDRISGLVDWQQMTYTLGSGSHSLKWLYIKDGSINSGSDCGWLDQVEWGAGSEPPPPPPPPSSDLSEALDTTLSFTTGGSADWYAQFVFSYYDGDAAQSGIIWHNQESWMQITVEGAGTMSFYWKVSSEQNYDSLEFYIDGVLQDRISGLMNWQQKVYTINTSGYHTLEWRYIKDGSVSIDNDCGWVDQVEWDGGPQPPPSVVDAWLDINSSHYYTCCGEENAQHSLASALEGISSWEHYVNHIHWFILDLGETYNIKKVKGCSNGHNAGYWDPTNVNIYVSDDKSNWGTAVATGISKWTTSYCCTNEYGQPYSPGEEVILQEVDTTPKDGRYIKVEIIETADSENFLEFGRAHYDFTFKIFDAYGRAVSTPP